MKAIIHDDTVVREIEGQRVQVLQKFADFELKAINKRSSIIQSRQLQVYLRSAAEFKQVIESLIESSEAVVTSQCSESSIRGQKVIGRLQQEADGKHNNLPMLENEAARLLKEEDLQQCSISMGVSAEASRFEMAPT
nr:C50C3.4 protein - Caenorhabditis elegans [Caenorhabditis elegans]